MTLNILAFGISKDIIKSNTLSLELDENATVTDLRKKIEEDFSEFRKLKHYLIAVNSEYANEGHPLFEKDEIAIIPPVSGG